jgi:PAS domain S-box-containing protein
MQSLEENSGGELASEVERLPQALGRTKEAAGGDVDQHEAQLRDALRAAMVERDQLRAQLTDVFDHAPIAQVALSAIGAVAAINIAGAELLGSERERVIGHAFARYVAHADRRHFLNHMRRCRRGHGPVRTELRLRARAAEAAIPIALSSHRDAQVGDAAVFWTTLLDLRERKRADEELQRIERLASLGTLVAGAAHEICNPLNAILLSAQVAAGRGVDATQRAELLVQIVEEARRCGGIVHNMLCFARDEPTQRVPTSLNTAIQHAVQLSRTYHRDCVISAALAEDLPPIRANPLELEQLALNLIKNAIEAGSTCVVSTSRAGPAVQLVVTDDGPGLSAEQLERVFDPFFTTKRAQGGTGLGLSVVRAIVARHGGALRVEAVPVHGARFIVEFPPA